MRLFNNVETTAAAILLIAAVAITTTTTITVPLLFCLYAFHLPEITLMCLRVCARKRYDLVLCENVLLERRADRTERRRRNTTNEETDSKKPTKNKLCQVHANK